MENNQLPDKSKPVNSGIDLKRLLGALVSKWYWFVISVTVMLTIGWVYLRYTEPVYQIRSSIMIDDQQRNGATTVLNSLNNGQGTAEKTGPNLFNEMFVLRSQDLVGQAIDSLDLNVQYYVKGRIKEEETYETCPVLVKFDSTGYLGTGMIEFRIRQIVDGLFELKEGNRTDRVMYETWIRRPYGTFKLIYSERPEANKGWLRNKEEIIARIEPLGSAVGKMLGKFGVNVSDGRTSLLDLGCIENKPPRGIDFMNVLIYFYQRKELEDLNRYLEKSIDFIEARKQEIAQDIKSIDSTEINIKLRSNLVDIRAEAATFLTERTTANKAIEALELQKAAVRKLQENILQGVGSRNEVVAGLGVQDQFLTNLVLQYNAVIQEKDIKDANLGPLHPDVLRRRATIAMLRKQIADACEKVVTNLDLSIRNATRNLYESDARLQVVPNVDKDIIDARRGLEVLQSTYLMLYQKDVETRIQQYAATNKSKVVVSPYSYGTPISPVSKTIYGMMFLLGCLVPATIVIVKVMMNNKIINEADIEGSTLIPIIGAVSRADEDKVKKNIVVGPNVRTSVAEQFRLIRANLEFLAASNNKRVFMVTSSISGEGKSFIALNLGITMTLAKKRVVIMEFDMRKPKLSAYLGLKNEGGISGYLAGIHGMDQVLKASGVHENLYIANCGPTPPNPGELMVLPTARQLIDELQEMFDIIIIDTAPLGLVSDALILSQYTDVNLFVVRQNYTIKQQVKMFDELYRERKIRNAAVIFNCVDHVSKYGYGYGGAYTFGYNYTSAGYYEEDGSVRRKQKPSLSKRLLARFVKSKVTSG